MNTENILRWFTGKARVNAEAALKMLEESLAHGSWLPRHSTKVSAALRKANVIAKIARNHRDDLEAINHYMVNGEYKETIAALNRLYPGRRGWELAHCMSSGSFTHVQKIDFASIRNAAPHLNPVIDLAEQWADDFLPVVLAIEKLDATRPVPTFTVLGVSPTVTHTLKVMGIAGSMETIRPCPIRWEECTEVNPKTGKTVYFQIAHLDPPAGTVWDASIHAHGNHCHACGHLIKNNYNWCPLLVDDAAGTPYLLMVGRDCAESLFGIKMTGELELAR